MSVALASVLLLALLALFLGAGTWIFGRPVAFWCRGHVAHP